MFNLDDPLIGSITAMLSSVDMCDDSHTPKRDGQRPASVLIPLVKRNIWHILLTRRPLHMPTHPGQISFPGGRTEAGETPCQGALRETREEIGIGAQDIHLLGRLPSFNAVSQYRVTPFVGVLNPAAKIIPCPSEVEDTIEIPFAFFMNPENHIPRKVEFDGTTHKLYDMPWPNADAPTWHIWGMTAMMLYRIYQRICNET
ncbi:MAG: CoA pyrophosphatase [Robiginitomaculum sp.]|nr:CoA pyrophosphatase [Robiginitomaculum sp.]